jgi:protein TonB
MWKVLVGLVALSATAVSQARVVVQRIRVSEGVSYRLSDQKVLPEISDLNGRNLNTEVVLQIVISKTGDVIHARAIKGNPALFNRSEEAALKWHYRPYIRNGVPIELDTRLSFRFEKNQAQVVVPPR